MNSLAWTKNNFLGMHIARLAYKSMFVSQHHEPIWWWKQVWKLKPPKKLKISLVSNKE
jgi:hypothetical protein